MIPFLDAKRTNIDHPVSLARLIQAERTFSLTRAKMSRNRTWQLFLEILLDPSAMAHHEADVYRDKDYRAARNRLADAVSDGEIVALAAHRCAQLTSGRNISNRADMEATPATFRQQEGSGG
ncbi:MAG: hypothetical protein ABW169_03960 [Sphingobium sp.]